MLPDGRAHGGGRAVVTFVRLDHVQLAMPTGAEATARSYYVDLLGALERRGARRAIAGVAGEHWALLVTRSG